MLMPITTALETMTRHLPLLGVEPVPLHQAGGRVLRRALTAETDQPLFDRSAMDGYAVNKEADEDRRWRVVRTVHAGDPAGAVLQKGEAISLFTGAEIPAGTARVIPWENIEREGDFIRDTGPASAPPYIRRRGEDCRAGASLLPAPMLLGPVEMAILAQHGVVEPLVSRLPRVLHLTSGDELVDPSKTPTGSQIRDTNGPLIAELLREMCGPGLDLHQARVPDRLEAFDAAMEAADWKRRDILIISGGAAKGDRDLARTVLEEHGFQYEVSGIDMRPGKPFGFARRDDQLAFVLPGNPVSHWSVWQTLIGPVLRALQGLPPELKQVRLPLSERWQPGPDRRNLRWPATLQVREDSLAVRPLPLASSGDLSKLAGANALIVHEPSGDALAAGDFVRVLLVNGF